MTADTFPNLARESFQIDENAHVLRSRILDGFLWLTHGVTLRQFAPADVRSFDIMAQVRRQLVPGGERLFFGKQVHGDRIQAIDPARFSKEGESRGPVVQIPSTDGLIVTQPAVPIAIQTADCVPLILVDLRRRCVALVHAGWRGTFDQIAAKAVRELVRQGSEAADIIAWMGPAVCVDRYEVGPELAGKFRAAFPNYMGIVTDDHRLDLIRLNAFQLREAGVPAAQIHAANCCTMKRTDICHSYRAEGESAGRMVTYAMIL